MNAARASISNHDAGPCARTVAIGENLRFDRDHSFRQR